MSKMGMVHSLGMRMEGYMMGSSARISNMALAFIRKVLQARGSMDTGKKDRERIGSKKSR